MVKYSYLEKGYLPKGVSELAQSKDIPRYQIISGSGTIQEKVANYHQFKLATESDGPFGLLINTHNFPGWKAFIDHQEARIDSNNSFGFMNIIIPPGIHEVKQRHEVEIIFTNTPIRSLANSISLVTFSGLLAATFWFSYKKLLAF